LKIYGAKLSITVETKTINRVNLLSRYSSLVTPLFLEKIKAAIRIRPRTTVTTLPATDFEITQGRITSKAPIKIFR